MTFTVQVDVARWREHHKQVLAELPGLVPVAKGNGYGIGNARLAQECAVLGVDTMAVGTDREVGEVADAFDGDILVLTPVGPDTSYDVGPAPRADHPHRLAPAARCRSRHRGLASSSSAARR